MIKLASIILNYKTPEQTLECVESLLDNHLENVLHKIVIVDNFSNDNSVSLINDYIQDKGLKDKVTLVTSKINGGFSYGNNLGIKENNSDFYLLINSDARVDKNTIKKLLDRMNKNPDLGLAGPRLVDGEGRVYAGFKKISPFSELVTAASVRIIDKIFKPRTTAGTNGQSEDWISFACVMIRKKTIEQVGYLDEGYFMYYEDVDFCLRAQKYGWGVRHFSDITALHYRGGSSPVKKLKKERKKLPRYYYESRSRYFKKFYGISGFFAANILWSLGWIVSKTIELLKLRKPHLCKDEWLDIWILKK